MQFTKQAPKTRKNPIAQRLIAAMEKPPHLTHEDVEALRQSIKEGKMLIKFDSPLPRLNVKNNELSIPFLQLRKCHVDARMEKIMAETTLPKLRVSREETREKIEAQIEKGQQLPQQGNIFR